MATIVGEADEITPGKVAVFQVEGKAVSVARVDGKLYAFSDICTHMGCSLSEGPISGNAIICSCHGSQFDVTTGDVVRGPARMPLETYTVEVVDGKLSLEKVVYEEEAAAATTPAAAPQPVAAAASPAPRPSPAPVSEEKAVDALSQVPLFQGLGQETVESLRSFCFRRSFKAGDLIVEEGRTGNGLFVILSGRVEVMKGSQVVATLGTGEPFGEMALLGEWPRTASVKAVEPTQCLGMDRWVFMAHIRRDPELAIRMLQIMAERLAKTDARIVE